MLERGTAERIADCPLSLNAIAKGYILEAACKAALEPGKGVRGVLLNVGGDMRACGDWSQTIGVSDPRADSETSEPLAVIEVRDRAVATSSRSQRGFRIGGRWYSHIFDPRTGRPAEGDGGRDRDRPKFDRRRRPGHDPQRPVARGGPEARRGPSTTSNA